MLIIWFSMWFMILLISILCSKPFGKKYLRSKQCGRKFHLSVKVWLLLKHFQNNNNQFNKGQLLPKRPVCYVGAMEAGMMRKPQCWCTTTTKAHDVENERWSWKRLLEYTHKMNSLFKNWYGLKRCLFVNFLTWNITWSFCFLDRYMSW